MVAFHLETHCVRRMFQSRPPGAHSNDGLFEGIANPLTVMRYHSLVVAAEDFPAELELTAWSIDRPRGQEIMALRHRIHPLYGVQFHPESIATECGKSLLQNFLRLAAAFRGIRQAAVV
jgi:anthranilate/para-aminobenzoate synthase component II